MKYIQYVIILISLTSCVDRFDVDLNSSDPQLVVEGNISVSSQGSYLQVRLSKTVNFDQENLFPAVENAKITISDQNGKSYPLTSDESGYYYASIKPSPALTTFSMDVQIGERRITAQSTLPALVSFDSLIVEKATDIFAQEKEYDVRVMYKDPENVPNYYHFIEIVNGRVKANYAFDDKFTDGSEKGSSLRRFDREYEIGDTVMVVMKCIDKNIYQYYRSLGYQSMGNPSSSSNPANPETNLVGAILGYFSAHTYQSRTVIVK